MIRPNMHYSELKDSYLFYNIAQKTKAYVEQHPGVKLLRMGIGDVSLPLCDAVIKALHEAVDDQASKSSFHGYMPECGASFLRDTIAKYYENRGVSLSSDEVFVSSGASDELGDILDLFERSGSALVIEPAYLPVSQKLKTGNSLLHRLQTLLPVFPQPEFHVTDNQKTPSFPFHLDTSSRYMEHSFLRNTRFQADQALSSAPLHFSYKYGYFRESVSVLPP